MRGYLRQVAWSLRWRIEWRLRERHARTAGARRPPAGKDAGRRQADREPR